MKWLMDDCLSVGCSYVQLSQVRHISGWQWRQTCADGKSSTPVMKMSCPWV